MKRPDFGMHETEFQGVSMECPYVAPGLTMQDLTEIFDAAERDLRPSDHLAGDPSVWPNARGIYAVKEAILNVIYPD